MKEKDNHLVKSHVDECGEHKENHNNSQGEHCVDEGSACKNSANDGHKCSYEKNCVDCSHKSAPHEGACDCGKRMGKKLEIIFLSIGFVTLVLSFFNPLKNIAILKFFDFGYITVLLLGYPIVWNAIKGLREKKLNSSALITISLIACLTLQILTYLGVFGQDPHSHSYIFAAGEVVFLMALGELIEDFTVDKARSSLTRLLNLMPVTAHLVTENGVEDRAVSMLQIGDRVRVFPSDQISADGVIVSGETSVDEAVITGESLPKDKTLGDKVYGGTFNTYGAIDVEVTKLSNESTVNKLKNLVMEAEGKKAPISRVADKWAGYIVPSALIISVIVFLVSYFFITVSNASEAIYRAVTVLVVFCPCALTLATPTAIAAGLGRLSKEGILVKSGGAIESLSKIKTIAFDKTGTITDGKLIVTDYLSDSHSASVLGAFAAVTESANNHPIGKALFEAGKTEAQKLLGEQFVSLVSVGASCIVNGEKIMVIKWDGLGSFGFDGKAYDKRVEGFKSQGKTVVAVIKASEVLGAIALGSNIKKGAKSAIEGLRSQSITSVMLTGDNRQSGEYIGGQVGIDRIYSELLPADKLRIIEELKTSGGVCMVGDGVNDAPGLMQADCGIAMGALGSDLAVEAADVALVTDDLEKLPPLIKFSKRVLNTIKINIILSLAISVLAVVLSFFGLLSPVTGALVHNVSSVLVVINSCFLLIKRQPKGLNK